MAIVKAFNQCLRKIRQVVNLKKWVSGIESIHKVGDDDYLNIVSTNPKERRRSARLIIHSRRKSERHQSAMKCRFTKDAGKPTSRSWVGLIDDYSFQGISVKVPDDEYQSNDKPLDLVVGSRLDFLLPLPDSPKGVPILLSGCVIWINSKKSLNRHKVSGFGLSFDEVGALSMKKVLRTRASRFVANRLCRKALNSPSELLVSPLVSSKEAKKVYRLLYREYLRRGYCNQNAIKMHLDSRQLLPETQTFTVKQDHNILGTISLLGDSPCGLPSDSIYLKELDVLRQYLNIHHHLPCANVQCWMSNALD